MAKKIFELKTKTGWKKLDDILERFQNALNERTPLASETIELDEQPDGLQICVKTVGGSSSGDSDSGGSAAGNAGDLFGAYNGAPAVFHLNQSAPPTPL